MTKKFLVPAALLIALSLFLVFNRFSQNKTEAPVNDQKTTQTLTEVNTVKQESVDFSKYNPVFRFSAVLTGDLKLEYLADLEAFNVYDPNIKSGSTIEQSQIFIRHFKANEFLTLSTVDILEQELKEVKGHKAKEYEIVKKATVPNFASQPNWRNQKHRVLDIRFDNNSPTEFYVFASKPGFSGFDKFIESLTFHNDAASFKQPLDQQSLRITKKAFGQYIDKANSPVQPERFQGFHTGTDYEILPGEQDQEVTVLAICGGKITQKTNLSGYGGLVTQSCNLNNEIITIIYGHISLSKTSVKVQEYIAPGQPIAVLGQGFSSETDNERKHLHLGIHKGEKVDIKGYVPSADLLKNWYDSKVLLPSL